MIEQTRKNSVLIVDDSRVSLMHLLQILQDDYIVHTAESGAEAIQIAKVAKPDVILLDVVMPQMDGFETLNALQNIHETKKIPVMFVTSLDQDMDEEKGLRLGAVDYIAKPYNPTIVKLRVGLQMKLQEQLREIQHLSMADTTTGLSNRRHFDRRLQEEWKRAAAQNYEIGILLANIDKFKRFNRINGLKKGDESLLAVAHLVEATATNPGDLAARWSDDGFAVLLAHASGAECNSVAENLRKSVADLELADVSATMLTISIGANSINPATADCTVEQFISNADSSLYLAKELGRNMVVVHS